MADNAITLQGLSAITRFIGHSTFQTQVQHLVLGWFVITTNHPLKRVAVWLFPGTSLEKDPPPGLPFGTSGQVVKQLCRRDGWNGDPDDSSSPATSLFQERSTLAMGHVLLLWHGP